MLLTDLSALKRLRDSLFAVVTISLAIVVGCDRTHPTYSDKVALCGEGGYPPWANILVPIETEAVSAAPSVQARLHSEDGTVSTPAGTPKGCYLIDARRPGTVVLRSSRVAKGVTVVLRAEMQGTFSIVKLQTYSDASAFDRCGVTQKAKHPLIKIISRAGASFLGTQLRFPKGSLLSATPLGCVEAQSEKGDVIEGVNSKGILESSYFDGALATAEQLRLDDRLPPRLFEACATRLDERTRDLVLKRHWRTFEVPSAKQSLNADTRLSHEVAFCASLSKTCLDRKWVPLRSTLLLDTVGKISEGAPLLAGSCLLVPKELRGLVRWNDHSFVYIDASSAQGAASTGTIPRDNLLPRKLWPRKLRDPAISASQATIEVKGCVNTGSKATRWLSARSSLKVNVAALETVREEIRGLTPLLTFRSTDSSRADTVLASFDLDGGITVPFERLPFARRQPEAQVDASYEVSVDFVDSIGRVAGPLGQSRCVIRFESPAILSQANFKEPLQSVARPQSFQRVSDLLPVEVKNGALISYRLRAASNEEINSFDPRRAESAERRAESEVTDFESAADCLGVDGFKVASEGLIPFDEPGFFRLVIRVCAFSGAGRVVGEAVVHVDGENPRFNLIWGGRFQSGGRARISQLNEPLEADIWNIADDSVPIDILLSTLECAVLLDTGAFQTRLPTRCTWSNLETPQNGVHIRADWRPDVGAEGAYFFDPVAASFGGILRLEVSLKSFGEKPQRISHWVSFQIPGGLSGGWREPALGMEKEALESSAAAVGADLQGRPLFFAADMSFWRAESDAKPWVRLGTAGASYSGELTTTPTPEGHALVRRFDEVEKKRISTSGPLGIVVEILPGMFGLLDVAMPTTDGLQTWDSVDEDAPDGAIVAKEFPHGDFRRTVCVDTGCFSGRDLGRSNLIEDLQGRYGRWYALGNDWLRVGTVFGAVNVYEKPPGLQSFPGRQKDLFIDPFDRIWFLRERRILDPRTGVVSARTSLFPKVSAAINSSHTQERLVSSLEAGSEFAVITATQICVVGQVREECAPFLVDGESILSASVASGFLHVVTVRNSTVRFRVLAMHDLSTWELEGKEGPCNRAVTAATFMGFVTLSSAPCLGLNDAWERADIAPKVYDAKTRTWKHFSVPITSGWGNHLDVGMPVGRLPSGRMIALGSRLPLVQDASSFLTEVQWLFPMSSSDRMFDVDFHEGHSLSIEARSDSSFRTDRASGACDPDSPQDPAACRKWLDQENGIDPLNIQALKGRREGDVGLSGVGMDAESRILFSYTLRGGRLALESSGHSLPLENVVGFVRSGFEWYVVQLDPTNLVLTFDKMRIVAKAGFQFKSFLSRTVTRHTRLLGINDEGAAATFTDAVSLGQLDSMTSAAFNGAGNRLLSCSDCADVLLATWEDGKPVVTPLPIIPTSIMDDGWWLESATLFKSDTEVFASVRLRHELPAGEFGHPVEKRLHVVTAKGTNRAVDFSSSAGWTSSTIRRWLESHALCAGPSRCFIPESKDVAQRF